MYFPYLFFGKFISNIGNYYLGLRPTNGDGDMGDRPGFREGTLGRER